MRRQRKQPVQGPLPEPEIEQRVEGRLGAPWYKGTIEEVGEGQRFTVTYDERCRNRPDMVGYAPSSLEPSHGPSAEGRAGGRVQAADRADRGPEGKPRDSDRGSCPETFAEWHPRGDARGERGRGRSIALHWIEPFCRAAPID